MPTCINSHVGKTSHLHKGSSPAQEGTFGDESRVGKTSPLFLCGKSGVRTARSETTRRDGCSEEEKGENLCHEPEELGGSLRTGRARRNHPVHHLVLHTREQARRDSCPWSALSGLMGVQPGQPGPQARRQALPRAPQNPPPAAPPRPELPFPPAPPALPRKCLKQQHRALNLGRCSSKVRDLQPEKEPRL